MPSDNKFTGNGQVGILPLGKINSLFKAFARKEGLAQAQGNQIINLFRLPDDFREFLLGLDDPKEIRKYSERRLRSWPEEVNFTETG